MFTPKVYIPTEPLPSGMHLVEELVLILLVAIAALLAGLIAAILYVFKKAWSVKQQFMDSKGNIHIPHIDLKDVTGLAAYMGVVELLPKILGKIGDLISGWKPGGTGLTPPPGGPVLPANYTVVQELKDVK